jgi:threonine aldolase
MSRCCFEGAARLAGSDEMKEEPGRHQFASDNTTGICPEAWAALERANINAIPSYGEDQWTIRLRNQIRELFETDCEIYFGFNGTAANALALSQLCQSFHSVVCHGHAHIQTDECGAPEFFTKGSKLLLVGGGNGKIDLDQARAIIARQPELHAHKPRAISITQATEFGTVYSHDEIVSISEFARHNNLFFHMDGARFANAVASLNCRPKEISWQAGVDVLCFGGTKNGLAGAELIIFFKRDLAFEFDYRLKQAGQLPAKMRFLAAQWSGLLTDDVWLRNARHANEMARRLAERLHSEAKIEVVFPVEANSVFVRLLDHVERALRKRGWRFYQFIPPDIYRVMCSWSSSESEIDEFISDAVCIQRTPSV